jgi:putative DNA primase/helicase
MRKLLKRLLEKYDGQIDMVYNKNDRLTFVDPNVFDRLFLELYQVVTFGRGRYYYMYSKRNHFWSRIETSEIKKKMRDLLQEMEPDQWIPSIGHTLMEVLSLECEKAESLKSPVDYINLKNGLFNRNTFELESHDSGVFSTTQLPFEYDPQAKCPSFMKFLKEIFRGDKALIRLIAEIIGYCLSNGVEAQKFFIFYSEGSSGKSTLCDIIHALAGGEDQVASVTLADLGKKFQRAQLADMQLNISTESDVSGALETPALKAITSGDPIQLEKKGVDPITHRVTTKLLFAVNTLPYPKDRSYAFTRRMIIVPFPVRFTDNPTGPDEILIDRGIKDELLKELPGIFNFAMRGLKRLKGNEFQFSESELADKIMAEYRRDINPIYDYIRTGIRVDESGEIATKALYQSFRGWCYENGRSQAAKMEIRRFLREFRNQLVNERISFTQRKSNSNYFVKGIAFTRGAKSFLTANIHTSGDKTTKTQDELFK